MNGVYAHLRRNKRTNRQVAIEEGRRYRVLTLIDQPPRGGDPRLVGFIVKPSCSYTVGAIPFLAHGWNIPHCNIAAGAGEQPKILDAGQKNFLGIISGVGENTWIETTHLSIIALYHDAVAICLDEVVIQNAPPLLMKKFSLTMRQECWVDGRFTGQLDKEVLELIG